MIAKRRSKKLGHIRYHCVPALAELIEEGRAKCGKPAFNSGGKTRRPGIEPYTAHDKTAFFKHGLILAGGRIEPGARDRLIPAERERCGAHSGDDGRYVPKAAKLRNETPLGPERAPDAANHFFRHGHPVKGGVGEHGVELAGEGERMAIHRADVETTGASGGQQILAHIHACHLSAGRGDFRGEGAIATAQIKNALPRLGIEPAEDFIA